MQPAPKKNDHPECWPSLMSRMNKGNELLPLMKARHELGIERYGVGLQPHNGRDSLQDALEEALDLLVYLEQSRLENPREHWQGACQAAVIDVALKLKYIKDRRQA